MALHLAACGRVTFSVGPNIAKGKISMQIILISKSEIGICFFQQLSHPKCWWQMSLLRSPVSSWAPARSTRHNMQIVYSVKWGHSCHAFIGWSHEIGDANANDVLHIPGNFTQWLGVNQPLHVNVQMCLSMICYMCMKQGLLLLCWWLMPPMRLSSWIQCDLINLVKRQRPWLIDYGWSLVVPLPQHIFYLRVTCA